VRPCNLIAEEKADTEQRSPSVTVCLVSDATSRDSIEIFFYIVLQLRGAFEGERLTVFRAIRVASIDGAIYQRRARGREAGDSAWLSGPIRRNNRDRHT